MTRQDVERLGRAMLARGLAPKTVRNVTTFLHAVFALALANDWIERNPVVGAARPKRRRQGDANPDLQFLTVEQLDLVLAAIPDEIVAPPPTPTRRGRAGPGPPPPPDVLSPVLRVLILAAAFTGLRQSELIGLRWKDVDLESQRIRVRNAVVRGEHSGEGKSDLSTRRSVPMTQRLRLELERWRDRSRFDHDDDLVFAHPQLGTPLDRTKVTRRFQAACKRAEVPVIRFHDLRHTFATQLAASGVPLRAPQEFLGHADLKTTQIYAHYARSAWELDMVDAAFGPRDHKGYARGPTRMREAPAHRPLVAANGIRAVTMSRIAAHAGIGRPTLYKYFSDVEAILGAWHERLVASHLDKLDELRSRKGTPGERLGAVLEAYALIRHQHDGSELAALLHRGVHMDHAHARLGGFIRDLLVEAAAAGDVRADVPPHELADYCLSALGAASSLSSRAAVLRLVDVTLAGMRMQR